MCLLTWGGFVAIAENSRVRKEIDSLTNPELASGSWAASLDQITRVLQSPNVGDDDKAYALMACMRMLVKSKKGKAAEKGLELYAQYKERYWGENPAVDAQAALLHVELQSLCLKRSPNKMPEVLDVIDKLADLGYEDSPDFNQQARDLYRARAHLHAEDLKEAEKLFQNYFATYPEPQPSAYGPFAQVYTLLGRHDMALDVSARAVERFGTSTDSLELRSALTRFRTLANDLEGRYDSAQLESTLPRVAGCRIATHALSTGIARKKLQASDHNAALAYARLEFDLASLDKLGAPLELMARHLLNRNEYEKVRGLMDFQKYGAAGPDGDFGTPDDLPNPMAAIPRPLSLEQIAAIEQRLAELPRKGSLFSTLKAHAATCLLLGRYEEAVAACRSAYMAATFEEARNSCGELAIAVKAMDGYPIRADRWLAYQATGPAGVDGVLDTKDDVTDPLAGQECVPLPLEMERALRALAYEPGEDLESIENREIAFLALGLCSNALEQACKGLEAAKDPESLERAVKNVAAAIKAFDGHVKRANDYLAFNYYGPEGPDGKLNTPDDMTDPLPAVLEEARAELAKN
jgi:tetratricopeptide (TPR) repeat protein